MLVSSTPLVDYNSFMFLFIAYKVIHIKVHLWSFCGDRKKSGSPHPEWLWSPKSVPWLIWNMKGPGHRENPQVLPKDKDWVTH